MLKNRIDFRNYGTDISYRHLGEGQPCSRELGGVWGLILNQALTQGRCGMLDLLFRPLAIFHQQHGYFACLCFGTTELIVWHGFRLGSACHDLSSQGAAIPRF